MLTIEKYNIFLECLFTLDDNYQRSDDYSVYAKNHAKYNRIQFMIRDYPSLKELKESWSALRNEKDIHVKDTLRTKFQETQYKILASLSITEEPCSVWLHIFSKIQST